jgi:hypothetical protein
MFILFILYFSIIEYGLQKYIPCSRIESNTCFIENMNIKSSLGEIWQTRNYSQIRISSSAFSCLSSNQICSLTIDSASLIISKSIFEAAFINLTNSDFQINDSQIKVSATVNTVSSQTTNRIGIF